MASSRSGLLTLHSLARTLPSSGSSSASWAAASSLASTSRRPTYALQQQQQQVRHASFSGSFLRNLIPRRSKAAKRDSEQEQEQAADMSAASNAAATATPAEQKDAPKGLFDTVTEDEDVALTQQRSGLVARPPKPATFVRSGLASLLAVVPPVWRVTRG